MVISASWDYTQVLGNPRVAPTVQSMSFKKAEITSWHLAFSGAAMGLGEGGQLFALTSNLTEAKISS